MRHKIREANVRRKTRTKAISDFLRRVMPDMTWTYNRATSPEPGAAKYFIVPKVEAKTPKTRRSPIRSTSREIETSKQGFSPGIRDDVDVTEEEQTYDKEEEEEEEIAGTGVSPYMGRWRLFPDTQYGIRNDGE